MITTINNKLGQHKVNSFYKKSAEGKNPICTNVVVINKKVFKQVGNFPENKCKKGGDVELWMRCMLYSEIAHTGKVKTAITKKKFDQLKF